jgi:hypothetical protein
MRGALPERGVSKVIRASFEKDCGWRQRSSIEFPLSFGDHRDLAFERRAMTPTKTGATTFRFSPEFKALL